MPDTPTAADDWSIAVRQALAEGQGVWTLGIVSEDNFAAVSDSARSGDVDAGRLLAVLPALAEVMEALTEPTPAAPVCLTCGTSFWRRHYPHAAVVLSAARDEPGKLLVSGVCSRCWTAQRTRATRNEAILAGLRRHYGLDNLRVLQPVASAGRA